MKRGSPLKRTPFKRQPKTPPEKLVWSGITVPGETPKPMRKTPIKRSRPKSTPARKAAKGQPCLIRLPGCAPGADNETVVLCHYALSDISGAALKSPDDLAAFGCWHCHGVVDGRLPVPAGYTRDTVRLAFAEAVFRTWLLKALQSR